MNIGKNAERVLKILWQEYKRTGQRKWQFGNLGALAKLCHVESQDICEVVKFLDGEKRITYKHLDILVGKIVNGKDLEFDIIELTNEGIKYGEERWQPWYGRVGDTIRAIYVATVEGVVRAFKNQ